MLKKHFVAAGAAAICFASTAHAQNKTPDRPDVIDRIGEGFRLPDGAIDTEIETAIESELWWSPYVDAENVDVAVTNGTVTLTGTVSSFTAKGAATDNAFEGGAAWVNNNLAVLD